MGLISLSDRALAVQSRPLAPVLTAGAANSDSPFATREPARPAPVPVNNHDFQPSPTIAVGSPPCSPADMAATNNTAAAAGSSDQHRTTAHNANTSSSFCASFAAIPAAYAAPASASAHVIPRDVSSNRPRRARREAYSRGGSASRGITVI
jgi:hypothetical protein